MDDDNGLELSLGLGCGGSSTKSKGKNGDPSETRSEESENGNKMVDDFKTFLHGGSQKHDSNTGSQMSDAIKPQENFFNDLSKANSGTDASISLNNRGMWVSNNNEDEKKSEASNKRKLLFDDMNSQKKHERDAHDSDLHDKKTSHISIAEDGSTAENEDVGESEVEASTSRLVSHHDDGSKGFIGVAAPSEVPKDVRGFSNTSLVDLQGQKRQNGSSEAEVKHGNINYGVPFSVRPAMNIPYTFSIKESAAGTSGHPISSMVHAVSTTNGEPRPGIQNSNAANLPVLFGYSNVQLPTLDKDNSWGLASNLQQFQPSFAGRIPPITDKPSDGLKIATAMQRIPRNASEATLYDRRTLERVKGDGKQNVTEEGSSSHAGDDVKGSNTNPRAKDTSVPSTIAFDFSAIKPGIAPDVKFGGCGSYPNLPWVSTTGSGPNGRTISGVTYRFSADQIKIVCACHGLHMSAEEFVRHASDENVIPESGSNLAPFANNNPAASAQS